MRLAFSIDVGKRKQTTLVARLWGVVRWDQAPGCRAQALGNYGNLEQ